MKRAVILIGLLAIFSAVGNTALAGTAWVWSYHHFGGVWIPYEFYDGIPDGGGYWDGGYDSYELDQTMDTGYNQPNLTVVVGGPNAGYYPGVQYNPGG